MVLSSLHSLIIEHVLGLYLIIMAIIMLSRANYYRNLLKNLPDDRGIAFIGASFALMLGLFLITIHNIWVFRFEVLVTVIAWLMVLKAILWLSFPDHMAKLSIRMYKGNTYYILAGIAALVGIILLVHGYYIFT